MGTFLVFVRDPGSVNSSLPIVKALRKRGHDVTLFAEGAAIPLLKKEVQMGISTEGNFPWSYWREFMLSADAVITTIASNGGTPREVVLKIREEFPLVPVVLIDELYGAGFAQEWGDPKYRPDWVACVNDPYAEQCIREAWPDFDPEKLVTTGYPALDRYAQVDVVQMQICLQRQFGLDEATPIITFLGQDTGTGQAYELLVQTLLADTNEAYLIPRLHPRMRLKGEWPEDMATIKRVSSAYRQPLLVSDSYEIETPDVIAGSNLVISLDSTGLMEASVLRIPNISIRTPEFVALRQKMGVTKIPTTVTLGCTAHATTPAELAALLKQYFQTSSLGLRQKQRETFTIDGKNADRTAQFLESLTR